MFEKVFNIFRKHWRKFAFCFAIFFFLVLGFFAFKTIRNDLLRFPNQINIFIDKSRNNKLNNGK